MNRTIGISGDMGDLVGHPVFGGKEPRLRYYLY